MQYIDRSHPILRGCRLLWVANSAKQAGDRLGRKPAAVDSGLSLAGGRRGGRVVFDGSGRNTVSFANQQTYLQPVKGLTVIWRGRVTAASSGTDTPTSGVVACRKGALLTTDSGWGFYHVKDTYPNVGMNFTVYGSSNAFSAATDTSVASIPTADAVWGGTWSRATGRQSIWRDGSLVTTNTISTTTYNANTDADITIGDFEDTDVRLTGEVEWLAVFDRELSPGEMAAWANDSSWPFLDEEGLAYANGQTVAYSTEVQAGNALVAAGAVSYATEVAARSIVGGDVNGGTSPPPPPGTQIAYYETAIGFAQSGQTGAPYLGSYLTQITVLGGAAFAGIVSYVTQVFVGNDGRGLIDGRVDTIDTGRYRR